MSLEDLGKRLAASPEACLLADANPSFVSLVDDTYIYRFVNRAYVERTGKARAEILGKSVEALWGTELFNELRVNIDKALAGESFTAEYHDRELGGVTGYVPHEEGGRIRGVWVFAQDIRQLQHARHRYVQQENLTSLNRLVAAVLHGLNTPLGALRGSIATLDAAIGRMQASPEPKDLKKLSRILAPALAGLDRTETVLNDLKALVRLDQAETQVVDINACLDSALGLMQAVIGSQLKVTRKFEDLPTVPCNPAEVMQVALSILQIAAGECVEGSAIHIDTTHDERSVDIALRYQSTTASPRVFQPVATRGGLLRAADMVWVVGRDTLNARGGDLVVDQDGDTITATISLPKEVTVHEADANEV